jgi:tape measure domain-containing protein
MVIEELYTRLGFQVDPKGLDKGKQMLSSFKKWVGGLAIGAGFTMLARTGIEAAMSMESLTAQFNVMAGSSERAAALIKDISDFAARTPFSKMGLAEAGKTLMAFGMQSESVIPTLQMLGDVAGADQNRLKSLALVFGQIQSTGRLMGQDLLQLINQGFNPLTVISKQTGISMADLKKAMEQGAISADMVTAAFRAATSEGGLFYQNLKKQSETLAGRLSTLKDNFVTALQNMAEAFLPVMKAAVDVLIAFDWAPIVGMVQDLASVLYTIPDVLDDIVTWAKRLAPLLLIAFGPRIQGAILKYIAGIKGATAASSAFAAIQAVIQRAALASGAAMNYQVTAMGLMKSAFFSIKMAGVGAFKAIGMAMKTALGPIGVALMAIEGFVEAYNWLQDRSRAKATEQQKANARAFIEQQKAQGKTAEQVLQEQVGQQEGRKARLQNLQWAAAQGGEAGARASRELMATQAETNRQASFVHALQEVYRDMTGLEFKVKSGAVRAPGMSSDTTELKKAFADIEKALRESTDATRKQTSATKENTRAQEKFDISALSRQAFDAAFNVKLRELTLGAIG